MHRSLLCRSGCRGLFLLASTAAVCLQVLTLTPARADLPLTPPKTSFVSPRTVLWLGRSEVLPFRVAAAAETDLTFIATPGNSKLVEVLRQPAVLAGETTGFLRVRALQAGTTRLTMQGGGAIDLDMRPDPAGPAFARLDTESQQPRIVCPMPGAVVWDKFGVGVELFDNTLRPQVHDQFHAADAPGPVPAAFKVQLRLPSGKLLEPTDHGPGPEYGPVRHFAFEVDAADMRPGPFRLTAVATPLIPVDLDHRGRSTQPLESEPLPLVSRAPLPSGYVAAEAESAIIGPKEAYAPARPIRFGIQQPAIAKDPDASGGQMVSMNSGYPAWCLPFTVKEAGNYQLFIRGRGDFGVGAYPSVALYLNNSDTTQAIVRLASSKYQRLPVGTPVHLDAGLQMLSLQFINDFNVAKEDRNFYFDKYELQRIADPAPSAQAASAGALGLPPMPRDTPPLAAEAAARIPGRINSPAMASLSPETGVPARLGILYPANNASIFGADAVVACAGNGASITWADVVIDGQLQNVRRLNPLPGEAMLFPLLARDLTAGSHHLTVRAVDSAGHSADSPVQLLTVLTQAPKKAGPYDRALRLLDRFGFGPEPKELAAILTLNESTWLNNRLSSGFDTPAERALLHIANTRYPQSDDGSQTIARALTQWIGSENPVRSRFTAWAENHFSTWMEKIGAFAKWREHVTFCRLGVAPFADLLNASSQSPAMLTYLDQEKSYAGKLNENYAREIMELHTLGVHGGYKQTDVTALASLLNGWTLAEEAMLLDRDDDADLKISNRGDRTGISKYLRFVPALNDGKAQRVFGLDFAAAPVTSRYDRIRLAIEMLTTHPSTADHICRKLAEHYVGVPAPDALVQEMAQVFTESGGDLRQVLQRMAANPAFWSVEPKVATPFDFAVRMSRLCRAATIEIGGDPDKALPAEQVAAFLKRSGMGLFDHISPDGYPQNSGAYSDSNALLQRWRFLQMHADVVNRLVPAHWRNVPNAPPQPAAGGDGASRPTAAAAPTAGEIAQRFIDIAAVRLTGHLLSAESNKAALDLLAPEPTPAMMREVLIFITMLPENNLR